MQPKPSLGKVKRADAKAPVAAGALAVVSLRSVFLWGGLGAGVVLAVVAVIAVALLSSPRRGKDAADPSLANLQTAQRTWWDTEGMTGGSKDPQAALGRLLDKQREWWENEELTKDGNTEGGASLARLEEMQRAWFAREGLDQGKPCKDPASAQGRLDEINHQWWRNEAIAKAAPETPGTDDSEPDFAAPVGPDPQVQLVDKANTRRFLDSGGTKESEQAVALALRWLAANQRADGAWSLSGGGKAGKGGRGGNPVVATGFALLPFLARGETHKGSQDIQKYTKPVEQGIRFLISQQKPDGDLRGGANMYTHAIATLALCEDFGMTADPMLKGPCQRAVDFIIKAQDPRGGGWRYLPQTPGDLSVSAWNLQALKSAQLGGIIVPRETLEKATRFLKTVAMRSDDGYQYQRGAVGHWEPIGPATTAYGILCRQYLQGNEDLRSPVMSRGVQRILAAGPPDARNMYYYYYATNVLFNIGDQRWLQWNPKMREHLIATQVKSEDAKLKGSWEPLGKRFQGYGGRLMTTSLALLTLEVYYRHLPLNRPELGDAAKDLDTKGRK